MKLIGALSLLCLFGSVFAAQLPVPLKAIYIDYKNIDYNNPEKTLNKAADAGFNMLIISFYLSASGPADFATVWAGLADASKISTMAALHARNVYVLVSFGGGTDAPYGLNPTTLGTTIGQWVLDQHLDGVDFDLENLATGFLGGSLTGPQTVDWIATISSAARAVMGPTKFISHAPQGPYFGPIGDTTTWTGANGGYTGVYQKFSDIDMFFVQFYNQGSCYTSYNDAFHTSCAAPFPKTSVEQLNKLCGIPLEKIIFGKPVQQGDAGTGYIDAATLNQWIVQARNELGWKAGVFGWVWDTDAVLSTWINTIMNGIPQESNGSLDGTAGANGLLGGRLSGGAIGGIVAICLFVVICAAILVVYILVKQDIIDSYRWKRRWDDFKDKLPKRPTSLPH